MTISGRRIGVAAACAAAVAAGPALAGETTDPGGLVQSTEVEREHGAVEIYQSVRRTDGTTPPAMNRMLLRLPPRAKPRFSGFTRCKLAKLQAFGPKGCPRRSKVGSGRVQGSYLQDQVAGTLLLYNGTRITGRRALLVHTKPDQGSAWVGVGRWAGRKLDLQLTAITTGYEPEAALSNYTFAFRPRFLSSPCDSPWSVTAFFVTGAVVTSADTTACP